MSLHAENFNRVVKLGLCLGLLNLAVGGWVHAQSWQEGPGYRFKPLTVPMGGKPGFSLLPAQQTGVWFTNDLPESRSLTNTILPNGSGVAAADVDGDGRCDLFFCGLGGASRLYRNLGDWKFEDITEKAGVTCSNLDATGAVFADIDGDGHVDLLVNSIGGGTHIFLNDGSGHFTRSAQVLNPDRGGTGLALADSAGTGRLDLYIANYRASTILDSPGTRMSMKVVNHHAEVVAINGRPLTDPEWTNRFRFRTELDEQGRGRFFREELGEPDVFCRNDGKGHFTPVPWTGGAFLDEAGKPLSSAPPDWGLSVSFRDFNGDGSPDLYVCNDFLTPDRLWLNDGRGRFRAVPRPALREMSFSSMGIDVADLNRDGSDDFLVVDMLSRDHRRRLVQHNAMQPAMTAADASDDRPQYPRNTLFLSRGDGTYAEIAQYAGVEASEWSWAPLFLDVDLDGYEDVLISNGFVRDNMNLDIQNRIKQASAGRRMLSVEALSLRQWFPPLVTPNVAFRNRGDLRFAEAGHEWGFDTAAISQGTCLADLDGDGDLDVIVNNLNGPAGLYRNNSSAPRVAVRLKGLAPNTRGIGARIRVLGGPVAQSQEMVCGGRYLSCDDTIRVFAAGSLTNRLRIEVAWRGGKHSLVADALPNCLYEVDEAGAQAPAPARTVGGPSEPLFEDASARLGHVHQGDSFDDFARQPLLPRSLSPSGPGVCWWDLAGNGRDDLVIGGGKEGRLACYQNDGQGGFRPITDGPWATALTRAQAAVVGWGRGTVLVGASNYEDGSATGAAVSTYQVAQRLVTEAVPADDSSVGPLAVADYDGDGALDLFVGGRVKPGRYPLAASSRLYHQRRGQLVLDEVNTARLRDVGLVNGAVWSDLDGDGWPELILACEWGPIRVFHNERGVLTEITRELGLADFTGWWNGVTTADVDGDGRPDIIAGNWGRNTKYERYRQKPLRLYYGDFAGDGSTQLIEAGFDPQLQKYVPLRRLESVTKGCPFLAGRFPSNEAWAQADMEAVLAALPQRPNFCEANWLESTVFLNRNGHFEPRILPMEAQFTPAFAVCVADFDGDGNEDLFLSQNFFAVAAETSRYDAGRGLWLKGDGHGSFLAVPGQESGIRVYGEQRGAAIGDFDADGRVDLVVTQNRGQTMLFHNRGGKPGLRVRLQGPEGNPWGIGAVVRLKFGDRFGPARELHGGSGYWSQDSPVLVLATPSPPTQISVRWPGGKSVQADLPPNAREIILDPQGNVRKVR